jgi:hypothetical protein
VKTDLGSLIPLAVLVVPFLYLADSAHPEKFAQKRQEVRQNAEIKKAFADKSNVIVIDLRGRG